MTTIPPGFYSQVMNSFYGTVSASEKEQVWQTFLANNDLTPESKQIDDPSIQQNFASYIAATSEGPVGMTNLSPNEVQKRTIMSDAFGVALEMLGTLQNTVIVQANNLIFYGQWQEEYTKLISGVPVYTPVTNGIVRTSTDPNDYDPTSFSFGYDNITVQDIANYVTNTSSSSSTGGAVFTMGSTGSATTPSLSFSINGATPQSSNYSWNVVMSLPAGFVFPTTANPALQNLSTANPSATISNSSPPGSTTTVQLNSNGSYSFITNQLGAPSTDSATTRETNMSDAFKFLYYNVLGNPTTTIDPGQPTGATANPPTVYDPTTLPNIPWSAALIGTDNTSTQARAEVNNQLQQDIDIQRANRTTVQNTAQAVQTNIGATKEGLNQQSTVITNILKTFQTIVTQIFQ